MTNLVCWNLNTQAWQVYKPWMQWCYYFGKPTELVKAVEYNL